MGTKLGKRVILIAEKVEEVKTIIEVARDFGVKPVIGVRIRLAAKSTGIWATSGGESAKFGLSTMDLIEAIDYLQKHGAIDCLQLVHFHIGSQIPDILTIKRATREATRYYAKLVKMGLTGIQY